VSDLGIACLPKQARGVVIALETQLVVWEYDFDSDCLQEELRKKYSSGREHTSFLRIN